MLQIYIRGDKESGFLDGTDSITLQMESVTDLYDEDLSQYDFSYPVEIPWTDNNRRLLNFAERIENGNVQYPYWVCDVFDDGFPEIVMGKLTILEKIGNFTYTSGKFNASISGTKGLFGSIIKNKTLKQLYLGGTINYSGKTSREFATAVMKGEYPNLNYIAFAPVAIENFFDKNRPDATTEFLVYDTVNNIMNTGSGPDDWSFDRPLFQLDAAGNYKKDANGNFILSNAPAGHDNIQYTDFRTIPFFQLKFVLKSIFKENGFEVSGDFMDDADFDHLFMFNNFSLENYFFNPSIPYYTDMNSLIVPGNHMPNMKLVDFLKGIFLYFNIYPIFDGSKNTVRLQYRKNTLLNRTILPLTVNVVNDFDSTYDTNNQNKGFTIQMGWDTNDQYHSDRVKEIVLQPDKITYFIGEKMLVATVPTVADLSTVNIGRQLTTDDCVLVLAENLFYAVANATVTPIKWDCYAEKLNDFIYKEGQRSIQIPISTLCTYVYLDLNQGLYVRSNYVGTRQAGSYVNNRGTRVVNNFNPSLFYISKQTVGGKNIPISYNHNKLPNGTTIEKYSLALYGEDGIVKNFHEKWQMVKEKSETIKTNVVVDRKLLQEMQQNNTYEVNGLLLLPTKTERNIPQLGPMTVYLTQL